MYESCTLGLAKIDNVSGAINVGGFDVVASRKVASVCCTVDDHLNVHRERPRRKAEQITNHWYDSNALFSVRFVSAVITKSFKYSFKGMMFIMSPNKAIGKSWLCV